MSQEAPQQHQPPFAVPTVDEMAEYLPQYEFERLAAFGGMGAVFKATQASLDRPVAIKILPPEFGSEKEFAERFKSEARAMAKLNHTHIVAVYDFGITRGGHLYLVMEWVEGHTLHEIIHKGSLPARKAANLAMQLCEALSYAHTHKILHRDIKPGNIMVTEDHQVKVADFGLARPITGEAEENPYGTPDYAAPEILAGGKVDQRVDIFAAGVVLYEMLTGRVPQSPRRKVTEFAPVSSRWDEIIERAVHPDVEKRFQDARDFRAQIAAVLSQAAQAVAIPVAVAVEDPKASKAKTVLKPLHFVLIGTAVVVIGVILAGAFRGEPEKQKRPRKTAKAEGKTEPAENEPKQEPKAVEPEKKPEPVVVMPAPEPEPKKPEPEPPAKTVAAAKPEPVVMPVPSPAPPPPENPLQAIQKLEESDPELAQLVGSFADEWSASADIDTAPEIKDLAGKYIPALQRSLNGVVVPEQRDHILSEISHVANREPLNDPDPAWPAVLTTSRKTYNSLLEEIQGVADDAARKMRAAQCELVLAKAKERAAAGNAEAAKRAEALAAELAKLRSAPSLKTLKQNLAETTN